MKIYLEELIKKGFLEKISKNENNRIAITKKGREFFYKYKQMKDFEDTFGL